MKYFKIILLLSLCYCINVKAQLGHFNLGLNMRLCVLPQIQNEGNAVLSSYGYTQMDLIINTPISLRYNSGSLIGFQYQIEYRKEDYSLDDKVLRDRIETNCKFIINSISILFKLNSSKQSNTSLIVGSRYYHSFLQEYSYTQLPSNGDSSFAYSSSKFRHLKTSFCISLSRETHIKGCCISFFREVFCYIPIYSRSSEIPTYDSNEFGITLGLAYNFGLKKM